MPADVEAALAGVDCVYNRVDGELQITDIDGNLLFKATQGEGGWEWTEVVSGEVAKAISYGIPEEQAEIINELTGEVSFEKFNQLVDLVVIKEDGQDVYIYSPKYETLVDLEAVSFKTSWSESFARTTEASAYIEYQFRDTDYDMDHYRRALDNVLQKLLTEGSITQEQANKMKNPPMVVFHSTITLIGYSPDVLELFKEEGILPFVKDPEFLVELNSPDNGPFTEHMFTVVAFPNLETGKLDFVKLKMDGSSKSMKAALKKWNNNEDQVLIITHYPSTYPYPDTAMLETAKLVEDSGMTLDEREDSFYFEQNISALAQPEIIVSFVQ